ncbi:MAG: hypothetical protein ACTHXA_03590 [Gulosibacter sp.]|uniref:hypothetical protein n=1 Tax=Gulosibacter sp. TaxID=2817531 RepID=UPI003F90FB37
MTAKVRTRAMACFVVLSSLLVVFGVFLTADRAQAALREVTQTGEQGLLALSADPLPLHWQDVRPGEQTHWLIEASLSDATQGTLALEMHAEGEFITDLGLTAAVSACSVPFKGDAGATVAPTCTGAESVIVPTTAVSQIAGPDAGEIFTLADLHAGDPRNLRVSLALPAEADPAIAADAEGVISIGLHASGEDDHRTAPGASSVPGAESEGLGGDLARTGGDLFALAILALGLIGLGVSVRSWRRSARDVNAEAAS